MGHEGKGKRSSTVKPIMPNRSVRFQAANNAVTTLGDHVVRLPAELIPSGHPQNARRRACLEKHRQLLVSKFRPFSRRIERFEKIGFEGARACHHAIRAR